MILAETSVWVDHFRGANVGLSEILADGSVLVHPFIIGELACGNLKNRKLILADLHALPFATSATGEEVLLLIDKSKLWGRGIGWADAHLLASALLSNCTLWTLDKQLQSSAKAAAVKLYTRE
ncbi:MAG: PIN domain-containing protein [Bryobacteraceae bacterium]